MAEHTAILHLPHHGKGDLTLCQPLHPLPPPRGRVARAGVGRKQDGAPLILPPLPIEFVNVGTALPPPSLHPTAPAPPPAGTGVRGGSGRAAAVSGLEGQGRGAIHDPEEVAPLAPKVLAGQAGGTLVLGGEDLPRCVVVDLQGNVVMQETHPPAPPYLVDQPILVQVGPGASQTHSGGSSVVGGPSGSGHGKGAARKEGGGGGEGARPRGHPSRGKAEFEPRWSFREMVVKEERLPQARPALKEECAGEESEGEEAGRPRRKSAKQARQKWKSIVEVEGGRGGVGRARRSHPAPPRDRTQVEGDGTQHDVLGAAGGEELPVWARRLSSVRVVEGQWVVGVAASNEVLQQTLEAHSRSVLCDYIKSHPSSLEQRHRAECQASRIMWQHQRIRFDGVPFTILSSNDLKCAFAMNYKLKRKNKGSGDPQQQRGPVEGVEVGGAESLQQNGDGNPGAAKDVLPKKKYKDVWFTSCPARISVKVIVKYPGFAVGLGAMPGERKAVMKALRRELAQGITPQREELYHVTMPLCRLHNHPLQGRSRGIHPSVDGKVVALLREGVTAPKVIQRLLERHVEVATAGDLVLPHPEDRAFHPRLKDIANMVYTRCRQMGITSRRRPPDHLPLEAPHRKRRRSKRPRGVDGEGEGEGEGEAGYEEPLGASTLQEAVQTFCTEESERGSDAGGEGRDGGRGGAGEVAGLAEMVRSQLDALRGLTYTVQEAGPLHEVCQALQGLINQYVAPAGPALAAGGLTEVPSATATFILQDPSVDSLAMASGAPCVAEVPDHLATHDKDGGEGVGKARGGPALRQLRPPVALQCLTTSMVPTVVSHLPRAPTHLPSPHVVTSSAPAPPTYQTLAPVAQDGPPPVHLSLPPYFYYVQEVTVPETSQTWTYSTSS